MNELTPISLDSLPPAVRDERIMAMCDRAISGLNEARTIEEVKRVGDMAAAFAAYATKLKAALEAQNQCQLVVLLAEARIGVELKAAQERGEVATQGDRSNVRGADILTVTLPEIGIPRQRASEMKKLAEAGPERIREEVQRATEEGRKPSRARIIEHRPRYEPDYLKSNPAHTQFILWLRTGAEMAARVGDADQFRRDLIAAGERIPPAQIEAVLNLISAFEGDE